MIVYQCKHSRRSADVAQFIKGELTVLLFEDEIHIGTKTFKKRDDAEIAAENWVLHYDNTIRLSQQHK